MRVVSAVLVTLLLPLAALAQVPQRLGYQGRLFKADGTPESGIVAMTFSVFAGESGGTPLWSETQSVGVTSGFYATFLGAVTPLPAGLFDGSDRYLALTIAGAELSPRQRVASVAYALRANEARSVVGGQVEATRIVVGGKEVVDASGKVTASALDTTSVQARVSGTCGPNGAIAEVKQDGTVVCVTVAAPGSSVTAVTAAAPLVSSGGVTPELSLAKASALVDGYLSAADFISFAARVSSVQAGAGLSMSGPAQTPLLAVDKAQVQSRISTTCAAGTFVTAVNEDGTAVCTPSSGLTGLAVSAPLASSGGASPTLSIAQASSTSAGYLSAADYAAFLGKVGSVGGGTGITVGGTASAPTVSVNTAAIQARVTGTCAVGSYVRSVSSDGTVVCGTDANSGGTVTAVTASGPLSSSGGATPNLTLSAASATTAGYVTAADYASFVGKVGSVTGGAGITVGGAATAPTVSVNTAAIQARVSGTCAAGSYVRAVNSDGTVVCGTDANSGGTVTGVTASGPLTSSGGATPNLSIPQATASTSGYLAAADYAAFLGKVGSITAGSGITVGGTASAPTVSVNSSVVQRRVSGSCAVGSFIRAVNGDGTVVCDADANSGGTVTGVTASGPLLSSGGATPNLSLPQATASTSGYLAAADYAAFLAKVSSVGAGTGASIGGTASAPTVNVLYGTTAGTAAQGNDPRLSDARAPTAGSGSYVQNQSATAQAASFNISGSATAGSLVVNGNADLKGNRILGVGTPTAANDAVNKAYVDAAATNANVIGSKPWVGRSTTASAFSDTFTKVISMSPLTPGNYLTPTALLLEGYVNACTGSFRFIFNYADGTSLTSTTYQTTNTGGYQQLLNTTIPTHAAYKGNVTSIAVEAYNSCGASYVAYARLTVSGFETGSAGLIDSKPWVGRSATASSFNDVFTRVITMTPLTTGNALTPTSLLLEGYVNACTGIYRFVFNYADGTSLTSSTYQTTNTGGYQTLLSATMPTHSAYKGTVTSIGVDAYNSCGASYVAHARLTVSGFETQ